MLKKISLLLIIVLSSIPFNLYAATATTTFTVSATIISGCSVTANDLKFGNYSPFSGTATNGTTTLMVTCTSTTPYNIGLNLGTGTGATISNRYMTSGGTNLLAYNLYQNSGLTTVWGPTIGTNTVTGTGNGTSQNLTVYGSIPTRQQLPPAAYNDTITVTVTY